MIKNECHHAYKLLDHAECLWCEDCVEKLVERLIQKQPLPDTSWEKSQITMEEAKTMIASLSNAIAELKKKKPEATEEWYEEKARKMSNIIISFHTPGSGTKWLANPLERCKDFLHLIVKEIQGK